MYLLYFLIQFERQSFVGASTSEPEGADSIRLVGRVKGGSVRGLDKGKVNQHLKWTVHQCCSVRGP